MSKARVLLPVRRATGSSLRVGCCAYSYRDYLTGTSPRMSIEDFIDRCAELGCDSVELTSYYFPSPISVRGLHRIARRCFLNGLEVSGTAVGNIFALPPGPAREAQINLVRHWIDLSADLGSPCLRVFAGAVPKGVSLRTGRQWVAECVQTCAEYAADHGVILGLENHGGVVATPEGLLDILRRVNSEWVGAKLDSGNFDSPDPYGDLAKSAPYAVSTHVKTEIRRDGVIEATDYRRLAALLRNAGYRGHLNLEYEGAEDAATAVPRAIADMLEAARH